MVMMHNYLIIWKTHRFLRLFCVFFLICMGGLGAVFRLTRIEHSIMLVVAVLAAELIVSGLPSLPVLAASLITPIFISMSSFAVNDYFDVEVDRKNKKTDRPLVSGELSKCDALYITYATLAIGIFASLLINAYAFFIAVAFGALAMLYSYRLKETFMLGNLYIAFSMAIPFIYGNYVVSPYLHLSIILVSIMIFLSGVAREIHGTVRDLKGDVLRKVVSLPRAIGKQNASIVALALYVVAVLISLYLFAYVAPFSFNVAYLILVALTDVILIYVSVGYLAKKTAGFYGSARNLSLIAMALALLAILIAPLTSGLFI